MDIFVFAAWFLMTALLVYIAKSTEQKYLITFAGIFGILFSCYLFLSPGIEVTNCFDVIQNSTVTGNTTTNTNAVICDTQTYGITAYLALIWLLVSLILIFTSIEEKDE